MSTKGNPNKPLPYRRHYIDQWRGNRDIQRLSVTGKGILGELLDEAWAKGFVVNDLASLAKIAGCKLSVFVREWEQIQILFRSVENSGDALLTSDLIEVERTEQDATRAKRAAAGSLGGKKKANASKCQQMPYSREEESKEETGFLANASPEVVPAAVPAVPRGPARLDEVAPTFMAAVRALRPEGAN